MQFDEVKPPKASGLERPTILHAGLASRIEAIVRRLNLPPSGREYLHSAMGAPSRNVASARGNWSGIYPSKKTGVTQPFESRTLEYPALLLLEYDDDCVAYFTQPPALKLVYEKPRGRRSGFLQTPDVLVVREDAVTLIECKPLNVIKKTISERPDFYRLEAGRWRFPAAVAAAREIGMDHYIWTETDLSPTRIRNAQLLQDYFRGNVVVDDHEAALGEIRQWLDARASSTIDAVLRDLADKVNIDHIYRAIAHAEIACDLAVEELEDHRRCRIFRDRATQLAFQNCRGAAGGARQWPHPSQILVQLGTQVDWDGAQWEVINTGTQTITLRSGGHVQDLPKGVINDLVRTGKIKPPTGPIEHANVRLLKAYEFLQCARPADLATANERLRRIQPYLLPASPAPSSRTERRYVASYRAAQASLGSGFVGLIPGFQRCGNRAPRLRDDVLDVVWNLTRAKFHDPKKLRIKRVHEAIAAECQRRGLPAPSYAWYADYLKRQDPWKMKRDREGLRAAYVLQPRRRSDIDVIDPLPAHPFEVAHIDHTQVDLETLCSKTGKGLGRPWLTLMILPACDRAAAFALSYEPPSYRSVLLALRDCVRRFGRLPSNIVVDGGKEFGSTWFESTCSLFEVGIIKRPPAQPRFGSQIERMFGTTNSMLLHCLSGNTQLRKNVRQMTDAVDPDRFSVWTLPTLSDALEEFLFDVYDTTQHRTLLDSPRATFDRLMDLHGSRPERYIAYDEAFLMATSPSTPKGTARVQPDGVKVNYLYYDAPALRAHLHADVHVRYDPYDLSAAYAYVDGKWIKLSSRIPWLRHRTESELRLALEEFRKRRGDVERGRLTETRLARFLRDLETKEEFLLARRRAIESAQMVHGEHPPGSAEQIPCSEQDIATNRSAASEADGSSPDLLSEDLDELATY